MVFWKTMKRFKLWATNEKKNIYILRGKRIMKLMNISKYVLWKKGESAEQIVKMVFWKTMRRFKLFCNIQLYIQLITL